MQRATVVVIGGGQSGLSAGYHLQRRGFSGDPAADRTFVVLDAAPAAGGAWRERWESLRMATVNGIFDLPGFAQPPLDPGEPSRTAVPATSPPSRTPPGYRSGDRCGSPPYGMGRAAI